MNNLGREVRKVLGVPVPPTPILFENISNENMEATIHRKPVRQYCQAMIRELLHDKVEVSCSSNTQSLLWYAIYLLIKRIKNLEAQIKEIERG